MKPPVFIVGTGRCGSTMMSNVVRLHSRLLSLSEFFTSLAGRAFTLRELDGERFWQLLTGLSPIAGKMLAKGGRWKRCSTASATARASDPMTCRPSW
jgi:putative sulfotransferase